MFVELTEVISNADGVTLNKINVNVRYIGVFFERDGKTIVVFDNHILKDNATTVEETVEEVKLQIDAALYGSMIASAPIV